MKNNFKTNGNFETRESVMEVIPFYFNDTNSNISICAFVDGLVSINVTFGNGKGWDSLEEDIKRETELSYMLGDYSMGYM